MAGKSSKSPSGKAKTQKSIMSFFGAPTAVATPAKSAGVKRKPVETTADDDDGNDKEEEDTAPVKKQRKTEPKPKLQSKKLQKEESKEVEEDEEETPVEVQPEATDNGAEETTAVADDDEEAAEQDAPDEQNDAQENGNDDGDDDDDDEEEDGAGPSSTRKPGRRRLRQRVVEEDSDSENEFDFISSKKEEGPIDMTEDGDESDGANKDGDKDDEDVVVVEQPKKATKDTKKPEKAEANATNDVVEKTEDDGDITMEDVSKEEPTVEEEAGDDVEDVEVDREKSPKPNAKTVTKAKSKATSKAANSFFQPQTAKSADTKKASATDASVTSVDVTAEATQFGTIPYALLAKTFNKIEELSGRLVIQDLLTNFFRQVIEQAPQDLLACIYLCVCTDLAPPFDNLKIGIGDAILMKSIGEATGTNLKFIKEMYHKEGDLGKVAQNARSKQHTLGFASLKPANPQNDLLSVPHVYSQFVKIAKMTGNNSQQQKCSIIKNLLVKCEKDRKSRKDSAGDQAEAAKYIIRGLQGKLRIGLAEKSILMALTYAYMQVKDAKDKDKQQEALAYVKKAFAECPSYDALVAAFEKVQEQVPTKPFLKVADFAKVAELCVLTPGTPVSPMLARPTKAYAMVFDRFEGQPFTCEYKYDGERAQIHIMPNGEISIFSRNFENSTERFPDVKLMITKAAKKSAIKSCIVDAEVVAVDKATNKRLPFQILSTRSRKNVKVEDIKVPVCIYAFDLIYLNGESLLTQPLRKRRELLRDLFEVEDGSFEFATSMDVDAAEGVKDDAEALEEAVEKVRTFLEEAVKENCEGLMVKTLDKEATYEPANRSQKWLKLKKDYLDGIGDSTDLVPIGAFYGRGKRTGVYGAYLLACYDPETESFQAITKLGTGLSDEMLKVFHEQLKERVIDKAPSDYAIGEGIKPDVWFEASCVWEILGADLSISPKYTAAIGLVAKDKGISLRFPRFIRIRDDKEPTQATNAEQIAELYQAQGLATVTGADDDGDDMLI